MMQSLPNIQRLIKENRLAEALTSANQLLAETPDSDEGYYLRGMIHWRMQNHSAAVSDYEHALALNPQSDARHALELARDVFNYFNPDLLNP